MLNVIVKPSLFVLFLLPSILHGADIPNHDLNRASQYGPQPLRDLIAKHLAVFPGSFPHRSIFFMPYLDNTIGAKMELERRLTAMPEYQRDMEQRGPMINLRIEATQDAKIVARIFDRARLDALQEKIDSIGRYFQGKDILPQLQELLARDFAAYKKDKLDYWDGGKSYEECVVAAIMLYALTKGGEDLAVFKDKITLEEGHIDYLSEEEVWRPALEAVEKYLPEKKRSNFRNLMTGILPKWTTRLRNVPMYGFRESEIQAVKKGDILNLYEVPADLATLRGFVGNDCATSVSFGFPYSPFERTYYVADAKNHFLGYVSLSLVEFRGKRTLFFHTIAGPEITHGMAEMIMRGVFASRELIGGELMVLPEDHRIDENINFSPIRDTMFKFARVSQREPVRWLDVHYRNVIIGTGSQSFYDSPERNGFGRIVNPEIDGIAVRQIARLGEASESCGKEFGATHLTPN